jgi:hypothetical protein
MLSRGNYELPTSPYRNISWKPDLVTPHPLTSYEGPRSISNATDHATTKSAIQDDAP